MNDSTLSTSHAQTKATWTQDAIWIQVEKIVQRIRDQHVYYLFHLSKHRTRAHKIRVHDQNIFPQHLLRYQNHTTDKVLETRKLLGNQSMDTSSSNKTKPSSKYSHAMSKEK
ncbi:7062_t:CDS:2, partial [Funneliformis mosseae]